MLRQNTDPATESERRFRRTEILGLANGVAFIVALTLLLSLRPVPSAALFAGLAVLLACAANALLLRRRFWAALEGELRRRKQAEQEARAAEILKGRFLADVSHEIRTPMNGILGMTELLLNDGLTAAQQEKVALVRTSAEALLALVGDILDLSRIEAGRLQLQPRDYHLRALTRDVLRLLQPRAAERGVDLRLHVNPALLDDLQGDPVRLRQVLLNLVSNAVRHTRNGTVTVTLEPADAAGRPGLRCEVRDTGVGIRPEVQTRLFQPFSQAESSFSRQLGGTGLGLVISRSIVELMGGEIGFESTPGVGSAFWFRVPLEPARIASSPAPHQQKDLRSLRQGLRVLVVDDQHVNRAVTRALLEELGFNADVVDSGEAALDILAMKPYDAVLLDCQMPGLNGFETCRRLRRQEGDGRPTLVIAVTADILPEDQERCLEAGMDDYLAKPLWGADLAAVLDRRLGATPKPAIAAAPRGELVEERLAALKRLGDADLQADVVRAFLLQGEHDLGTLRSALERNDAASFADAAHALSGSSGVLGGQALAELAGELAVLARQGDLGACAERLPALEREFQAFIHEISS